MHQSFISAAVGVLLVATATASIAPRQTNSSAPLATTKNGTLIGRHNAAYNQDFFLGIPYATPPLADLRFNNPIPYNETYESKDSTEYGKTCYGYGVCSMPSQPTVNLGRGNKREC